MKKLLLTLMMLASFGIANLAYADYHYDNIPSGYKVVAPHDTVCYAEYKAKNDPVKLISIWYYFKDGETGTIYIENLFDNISKGGYRAGGYVWWKESPLSVENNFSNTHILFSQKGETCVTNISPSANLFIMAKFGY